MAGGPAVITMVCMRAAGHCLDTWAYAPQVPHAPVNALGALQMAALCLRAPHRSQLYTPTIHAPGGGEDSG